MRARVRLAMWGTVLGVGVALVGVGVGALLPLPTRAQGPGSGSSGGPVAAFTVEPGSPDINTEVVLDASASRNAVRYEWDLDGDGDVDVLTREPRVVWLFDEGGSYTLVLRVTDEQGRWATASQTLVVRSAPVRVRRAIETPLAPNRVPAGSAFQVTVTIDVLETVNGLGLDEDPPPGWRVSGGGEAGGAAFKGAEAQWLWFRTLQPGETVTVVYGVTVPRGTAPDVYEIQGVVSSFSPRFQIAIPGDRAVRVF